MILNQNMIQIQAKLKNYIEYTDFTLERGSEEENQLQLQKNKIMIIYGNIMEILKTTGT